jgi:hypothetical protein
LKTSKDHAKVCVDTIQTNMKYIKNEMVNMKFDLPKSKNFKSYIDTTLHIKSLFNEKVESLTEEEKTRVLALLNSLTVDVNGNKCILSINIGKAIHLYNTAGILPQFIKECYINGEKTYPVLYDALSFTEYVAENIPFSDRYTHTEKSMFCYTNDIKPDINEIELTNMNTHFFIITTVDMNAKAPIVPKQHKPILQNKNLKLQNVSNDVQTSTLLLENTNSSITKKNNKAPVQKSSSKTTTKTTTKTDKTTNTVQKPIDI